MNYGYNEQVPGYKLERENELASALQELVLTFNPNHELGCLQSGPYVEVNDYFRGVRIRRITNMSNDDRETPIKLADAVYQNIMGVKLTPDLPRRR